MRYRYRAVQHHLSEGDFMKTILQRVGAGLLALVASIAMLVGTASPASAVWSQCDPNFFCLWDGNDASGPFHAYHLDVLRAEGGVTLPSSINNKAQSFRNRTGVDIVIFDNADCYMSGWYRYMSSGQQATSQGSDWGNRVSSVADPTRRNLPC